MGMLNFHILDIPSEDGGVNAAVGVGSVVNASDLVAGYSYQRGTGAYTATLQGSVAGQIWADIATLDADGQGVIPSHYTQVRVKVTVIGAIGTSQVRYFGKS